MKINYMLAGVMLFFALTGTFVLISTFTEKNPIQYESYTFQDVKIVDRKIVVSNVSRCSDDTYQVTYRQNLQNQDSNVLYYLQAGDSIIQKGCHTIGFEIPIPEYVPRGRFVFTIDLAYKGKYRGHTTQVKTKVFELTR